MKLSRRERREKGLKKQPEDNQGTAKNHNGAAHAGAEAQAHHAAEHHEHKHGAAGGKSGFSGSLIRARDFFFDKNYKKLGWIPSIILILAIIIIAFTVATTGSFIYKDISLKGGMTITVQTDKQFDTKDVQAFLSERMKNHEVTVRDLSTAGHKIGLLIDADIEISDTQSMNSIISATGEKLGITLTKDNYTVEMFGSSLSNSFFKETIIAVLAAFLLMAIVVLVAFRDITPSSFVVLAAFSTIIETLAVIDLFHVRVSTAGIAAFLMLIGYSVDTDILLTTRVLKREHGTVYERILDAMRTGLNMTSTAIVASLIAFIFTPSEVLKQIMGILLIGLCFDIINTWLQNAVILRRHVEKIARKKAAAV